MCKNSGWVMACMVMVLALTSGCTLSLYSTPEVLASPTIRVFPTGLSSPTAMPVTVNPPTSLPATALPSPTNPAVVNTPVVQASPINFCADGQATGLINRFKNALQTSSGELLASLVSPKNGMEVRRYRNGRVVNYDQAHAKFLFDTTYEVDWGPAPGSGLSTKGPFHEVILPVLLEVFNRNYTLTCNRIQVGGASYPTVWPYAGVNFYSVHFPGTSANGNLDWGTWLLGMEYVNGKPFLYALVPYQWEP